MQRFAGVVEHAQQEVLPLQLLQGGAGLARHAGIGDLDRLAGEAAAQHVLDGRRNIGAADLQGGIVHRLEHQLVRPNARPVALVQLDFGSDARAVYHHPVGAAAVGDHHRSLRRLLYHRVKAGDAGVVEHQIVGVATADGDDRLGQFQDAALAVGRRDDESRHGAG